MTTPDRAELELVWARVRAGFAEYKLDDLRALLDLPPDAPVPDRAQAKQFADALPDLSRARFLRIDVDGDLAGYYAALPASGTDVAVVRFRRTDAGWKPAPAPNTLSSYSTDEKVDPVSLIAAQASLALRPDGAVAPEPPAGAAPADTRPEAEIRRDLETMWKRIRSAFASGRPDMAAADLLFVDGAQPPSADEAKAAARDFLPDLARGQFLKLGWKEGKPHLVGYYAETKVGDFKTSTVSLVVFVHHKGRWKFAPGPAAIETVQIPRAPKGKLLELIESDSRLRM
jgi:hypothetical protein